MDERKDYRPDQVFDHDFDGIQEYDNRLPNWWLWILWTSIVFAFGYWLVFHTFGVAKLPRARYEAEMQRAAAAQLARGGTLDDAALELMATLPDRVAEGKTLFITYCVACHSARGEGLVGPNLTDAYWIHGGKPLDIHKTVTDGVLTKGMAAWGRQLGPKRVESVVAYVLTLRGTNVPGKVAEGELVQ
jgi:cytochrome c oxidase cbb3-type subunit III